ncbi:MAG: hypothetical protein JNM88_13085 [Chitinophagaceae bacterium]|nr:hypothetical protein [Chitinophagaceae bacterium]
MRRIIGRKLAVLFLLTASAVASFATLGDGKKSGGGGTKGKLLSGKTTTQQSFSLRSGYSFRGNQILTNSGTTPTRYIRLNTTVTMQNGKTTYVVPLKKKVGISNIKIDIGNRQFQRN